MPCGNITFQIYPTICCHVSLSYHTKLNQWKAATSTFPLLPRNPKCHHHHLLPRHQPCTLLETTTAALKSHSKCSQQRRELHHTTTVLEEPSSPHINHFENAHHRNQHATTPWQQPHHHQHLRTPWVPVENKSHWRCNNHTFDHAICSDIPVFRRSNYHYFRNFSIASLQWTK